MKSLVLGNYTVSTPLYDILMDLKKELTNAFPRVQCLAITPEHMTGKLVNEK